MNIQMKQTREVRHEPQTPRNPAQTQGPKVQVAQGENLPTAPRQPQTATVQDHYNSSRAAMSSLDPMIDPFSFWASVADVTPDQLVFAPGHSPRSRRRTHWLGNRLWISAGPARVLRFWRIFWFGPRHPNPPLLPPTPLNLAPWSNQLLPNPRVTPAGSAVTRFRDRLLWHLSHPGSRYETHAWRCEVRANVQLIWRLKTLQNTLAGRSSGPPPWIGVPPAGATVPPQQPEEGNEEYAP